MRIRFDGGTDTVTGSLHRIEVNGTTVLRDCGLFQGRREEARKRNSEFPFDPAGPAALVLSHAHIDHCGNIPSLVRQGFRGPVHATTATVALCDVMLHDAAKIQEQDAAYLNQKTSRKGLPEVEPLYTTRDADRAMTLFHGHHYGRPVPLAPGVTVTSVDAGHILGSALNLFELEEHGRRARVGYAFDLGRKDLPLIRDPEFLGDVDVLVLESTYGDRRHAPIGEAAGQLAEVVRRTLARGGKVLIPSFALERAQEVLYHLNGLFDSGDLPPVPVFVDSPMAGALTRIFERHIDYMDEDFVRMRERMGPVLLTRHVKFATSVEESKAVTGRKEPCIVIAASGMCEHGRILHHLKHGVEDERNTIVIVGFQAPHTLGRRIVEGASEVRIFGDLFPLKAEVAVLPSFSAHADRDDLLNYVRRVRPRRTCLVHGEAESRAALAETLRAERLGEVMVPAAGDVLDL